MRKILITGGVGFIGSNLARQLLQDPENQLILVDNLLTGNTDHIPDTDSSRCQFIRCDVNEYRDIAEVMISHQFDYVFHLAAVVGVHRTLRNPQLVLDDLDGIRNVLDLSKNTSVKQVYYTSSSEVYGEAVEFPQNETGTPLNSRLPYAVVKNAGEAFLRTYKQTYDLDYTIFRLFNTYGPCQNTDFVVPKFIQLALANKPIPIYGNGSQTRTFCYIDDTIGAITQIFNHSHYVNDVVNIGNEQEITILELANLIIELTGSSSEIQHLPPLEEGDMERRCPDTNKMRAIMDTPPVSLHQGLRETIDTLTAAVGYERAN